MGSMKTGTSGGQRTGESDPRTTGSKAGRVPSRDGAPGQAPDAEVFGQNPAPPGNEPEEN